MIFRNPINIELLSGWFCLAGCLVFIMKLWKLFVYACFVFLKWVVTPFFKNSFFWWNVYDSNFLHLLLHALKAKGLADLQTYTGNGRTGYSNAYGLVLLKPHNPCDTSWKSSQHGLVLHIIWQVAAILISTPDHPCVANLSPSLQVCKLKFIIVKIFLSSLLI